jgi:hypothetical protein
MSTGGTDSCPGYKSCTVPFPVLVNFSIDTSSGMGFTNAPSTKGRSKWDLTREILHRTFASLPASWEVGATLFNGRNTQTVPILPLNPTQRARLDDAIDNAVLEDGMPLFFGWSQGMNLLADRRATHSRYLNVLSVNVLVVDGTPTENLDGVTPGDGLNHTISQLEYDRIIQAAAEGTLSTGTITAVAGVPGSDDPQGASYDPLYELSLLAAAGGSSVRGCTAQSGTVTSCYDSTNQRDSTCLVSRGSYCHQDLNVDPDLGSWLELALQPGWTCNPCIYPLAYPQNGAPFDTNAIRLIFTRHGGVPTDLLRSRDDCASGDWILPFDNQSGAPIHAMLCPAACDLLTSWDSVVTGGCMEIRTGLPPGAACEYGVSGC